MNVNETIEIKSMVFGVLKDFSTSLISTFSSYYYYTQIFFFSKTSDNEQKARNEYNEYCLAW